jgi:hypothetical protein
VALAGYGIAVWSLGDLDEVGPYVGGTRLARARRAHTRRSAGLRRARVGVAVERARRAASVEECAAGAPHAMEIARDYGDADLEVFALSLLGRAEVSAGRVEEGSRKLEEAMAAATAGRVRNIHTLGEAYCNLITACTAAGDWNGLRSGARTSTSSPRAAA